MSFPAQNSRSRMWLMQLTRRTLSITYNLHVQIQLTLFSSEWSRDIYMYNLGNTWYVFECEMETKSNEL